MEQTKTCHYCGEIINSKAVKCKHCGEWLDKSKMPQTTNKNLGPQSATGKSNSKFSMYLLFAGAIILTLVIGWSLGKGSSINDGMGPYDSRDELMRELEMGEEPTQVMHTYSCKYCGQIIQSPTKPHGGACSSELYRYAEEGSIEHAVYKTRQLMGEGHEWVEL